jgi:hypothetical protein
MRAISLWQPWASAIPLGLKHFETRLWSTEYRGPLIIHAAKGINRVQRFFWRSELTLGRLPARLPLGGLVAIVDLVSCRPTDEVKLYVTAIERLYGDYSPGRFAWGFENIRPIVDPIPWRGAQGFFNVPDEVLSKTGIF